MKFLVLLFTLLLFINQNSYSATQGTVGATSTGDFEIEMTINDVVRIHNVNDINFPAWTSGDGDVEAFDDICIYSNGSGGSYRITASSSEGAFQADGLGGGAGSIDYNVYWNDEATGTKDDGTLLTYNSLLASQTGASTTSLNCNSGSNLTSRVTIEFLSADLSGASTTTYSGTLILEIEPE